jgi:hypothetical protein
VVFLKVSRRFSEKRISSIVMVEDSAEQHNHRENVWLRLDPEDGGDMFLRNVGWHSAGYLALYQYCSQPPL